MKVHGNIYIVLQLCAFLLSIGYAEGSTYDYSASIECIDEPKIPQYKGGLMKNPKFDNGLEGWELYGIRGKIEVRESTITSNRFIVAYDRAEPCDSFSQKIHLKSQILYIFSAWVQINKGNEVEVDAYTKSHNQTVMVGSVLAQSGCWSMLKGGISVDFDSSFELYFQSNNTSIELWVDNVSLKSFTKYQWRDHQLYSIEKVRKRKVRLHVSNKLGKMIKGAKITINQTRPHFPLGCALASTIIHNKAYQDWFAPRFTATTFDNEMKWYYTEPIQGHVNYSDADAMLAFAHKHNISVRGHNIFWDNPLQNTDWVKSLSKEALMNAALHRLDSVVSRYSGKLIHWDVINENLHFSFFEDKLGFNITASFYTIATMIDSHAIMFMNEFNTLEFKEDTKATPPKYVKRLMQIKGFPLNKDIVIGIGLQGHFGKPNVAYIRACLDILGATKMPIWLTELDVQKSRNQAKYLEEIMREAYSHPSVKGMIIWSGWRPTGCSNMCLTDNNFINLPTGDVVDKLIKEWKTKPLIVETDDDGVYEDVLFHGHYDLSVSSPNNSQVLNKTIIEVSSESFQVLDVRISL